MEAITGQAGELIERLVDTLDRPGPQLRAVVTTLLIKAVEVPDEWQLMETMVASDGAAAIIDPTAAAAAGMRLRGRLVERLSELAAAHGEATVVRAMRDYLLSQIERWAAKAVDDVDNRRRAERFLAWAERPEQLQAAQRRGLFLGMDVAEFRRLAETRVGSPVTPETAVELWAEVDRWVVVVDEAVGDAALDTWEAAAGG